MIALCVDLGREDGPNRNALAVRAKEQWATLAGAFGVDFVWYALPKYLSVPLVELAPLKEEGAGRHISLEAFQHPESCCYWFGCDHGNVAPTPALAAKFKVYLPLPRHSHLWAIEAASIVLYDRHQKVGCR